VGQNEFTDSTLVVLGHGTDLNEGSALPVQQHAGELRRRGLFAEVREAFWKQEPHISDLLTTLTTGRVFIVPLFISEGYFSEQVIPGELGFSLSEEPRSRIKSDFERTTYYCRPVGTHHRMTEVILARAREVTEKHPFPRPPKPTDTTLFIAGHGTKRNAKSRQSVERQVELIRDQHIYAAVHGVFMDDQPPISQCYSLAQTHNLIVVPFFISDGLHTVEDIPVLLGEPGRVVKQRLAAGQPAWRNPTGRHDKLVWYATAVGTEPGMADVILDRVREAATWGKSCRAP